MQKKIENINRRKLRNRFKVKKSSVGVPRLSVFRSARHIFGQIIDDTVGKTLVQASTLEQDLRKISGGNIEAAQIVEIVRINPGNYVDKKKFLSFEYTDKEYNSYEDMVSIYPELCLGRENKGEKVFEVQGDLGHYGVTDEHPSKHFHKLISEVLLNKLKKDNE